MAEIALDSVDVNILRELQTDSRLTNVQLARRVPDVYDRFIAKHKELTNNEADGND